jgi:TPP-dependent indolepyruvate ferredoxin oxidoreductase alpha subunit
MLGVCLWCPHTVIFFAVEKRPEDREGVEVQSDDFGCLRMREVGQVREGNVR